MHKGDWVVVLLICRSSIQGNLADDSSGLSPAEGTVWGQVTSLGRPPLLNSGRQFSRLGGL